MRSSAFIYYLIGLLSLPFFFLSCIKGPDFPDEPRLEFVSISRTVLNQGLDEDSTELILSFTDGDGNLGNEQDLNVFFIDLRDTSQSFTTYRIPFIPEEGVANGISGELYIELESSCCIYENNQPPCTPSDEFPMDTVQYEVYIVDRAGNESNRVLIPPITLLCN